MSPITYGGEAPSLSRSLGFDYDPSASWSFRGSIESGRIDSGSTGVFRRTAATLGVSYTDGGLRLASDVEARFEHGVGRDQSVWLVRNRGFFQFDRDWRALATLNFAIADNDSQDLRAADYIEASAGLAYRPVLTNDLNAIARFEYLRDMGPVGQVTQGGQTASPRQTSGIFSVDATVGVTRTLSLGGRYAYRVGRVSLGRDSAEFVSSTTHLGVVRADWRVVRQWDALVEGHYLGNDLAADHRWGGLAALYRHLNDNVKLGAGYSFSDFSSNLADQSYTSRGFFINLLGKF